MLEELEAKVKKYERWSTVDVDGMLSELDQKNRELDRLQSLESQFNRSNDELEVQRERVCSFYRNSVVFETSSQSRPTQFFLSFLSERV